MAEGGPYQKFVDFLSPADNNLTDAIQQILFPDKTKELNTTHYRYVVVPLVLDLLEQFYQVDGVIDANTLFYKILDNYDLTSNGQLDEDIAKHFTGLINGFLNLATDDAFINSNSIVELIEDCFPALSDCLNLDSDGARKPTPGHINFERFLFNLKHLTVS